MSGFTITALLAAVVLSGWLPDWVTALLILGAGVWLTYALALISQQQANLIRMQALVRALQDLQKAESYQELTKYLEMALYRVITGEEITVKVLAYPLSSPSEDLSGWDDLVNSAEGSSDLLMVTKEAEDWFALPVNDASGKTRKIILCWKQKHNPAGLPVQDREHLNTLAVAASRILTRLIKQQEQEQFMNQLLHSAVKAGEDQIPGFSGHGQRVALIADFLGQQLGLDERESRDLHYAALLHDIGRSPTAQNGDEDHPGKGAQALPEGDEWQLIREAIQYHHERYDGSGFPEGKRMIDIPLSARILAAADIFDGLTALAPEEDRLSPSLACQVIQKATGSSFDPLVVVALQESLAKIQEQLAVLAPPVVRD